MNVRFEFRKSTARPVAGQLPTDGVVVVLLRFEQYPRGSVTYGPYTTGITTTRAVWDTRRSIRLTPDARELNRQLQAYQSGIETAHAHLSRQITESNSAQVMDGPAILDTMKRLSLGDTLPISLLEVYTQFLSSKKSVLEIDRKRRKIGQISLGTYNTYPKRWALIYQFLLFQKRPRLPVASVGFQTATDLKEWLTRQARSRRSSGTYDPVTIKKVIGLLKMLLTYAQSKEYIRVNPLATFTVKGGSSVANPKPLTEKQMHLMESCELPPMLRFQVDSWLVAAELCLHYADYMELPTMRFVRAESGNLMVQHDRVKQTGTSLLQTVNVTERAERLLAKYNGPEHLYYTSSGYFSRILKKAAVLADLRDRHGEIVDLQFGMGRDTGLTSRAMQGANTLQLSKNAGWADPTHADKYIGAAVEVVDNYARSIKKEK